MDLQSFSTKFLTTASEVKAVRKYSEYQDQSMRRYNNIFDQSDQEKKSIRSDTRRRRTKTMRHRRVHTGRIEYEIKEKEVDDGSKNFNPLTDGYINKNLFLLESPY